MLPVIVGVEDEAGERIDVRRSDGTRGPIMLRLTDGFEYDSEVIGGLTRVSLGISAAALYEFQADGVPLTTRNKLNWVFPLVATDDPVEERTDITVAVADDANPGLMPTTDEPDMVCVTGGDGVATWAFLTGDHWSDEPDDRMPGDKVDPAFGSQNISCTGSITQTGGAVSLTNGNASFTMADSSPVTAARSDAVRGTVLAALVAQRATAHASHGDDGIGVRVVLQAENDAGTFEAAGIVEAVLDDAADGSEDSSIHFYVLVAGVETKVCYLDGTTATLAAGKSLSGAAGSGSLLFGSMTGPWTMPTGNGVWAGATDKTLAFTAQGASGTMAFTTAASLTLDGGSILFKEGNDLRLTLDSAALTADASLTVNLSGAAGVNLPASGTSINSVALTHFSGANINRLTAGTDDATTLHNHGPVARKTINEDGSGTTLQADDALQLALEIGTYDFELVARISGATDPTTMDYKWTLDTSGVLAVSSILALAISLDDAATAVTEGDVLTALASSRTMALQGTQSHILRITGTVVVSTAGTLQFQWAKNANGGGNNLTVHAGSYFRARRVA